MATFTLGDNVTGELVDGVLTISGTGATYDYAWNGSPFYQNATATTSVVVESGITGLGSYLFSYCSNITSLTLASSVTTIKERCFRSCKIEGTIDLSNVTTLGHSAFYFNTGLTSITSFNVSLTTIPISCFSDCNLSTVNLSNVTSLGTYAFFNNNNLTSITSFNANLTTIPSHCFRSCNLTGTIDLSNITSLGVWAFAYSNNLTSITAFNANLTTIPDYCFRDCDLTGTIDISNVTTLGIYTFASNNNLTSITYFNASLTTLPDHCFRDCNFTGTIDLVNITYLGGSNFLGSDFTTVDLSKVTHLGYGVFRYHSNLTSITSFNANLTSIGHYCFQGCDLTGTIDLSNITSIGYGTFASNNNLTSITAFNSGLTEIGDSAFHTCDLRTIDLSNLTSLTQLVGSVFRNNYNLTSITTFNANLTSIGSNCFNQCDLTGTIDLSNVTTLGNDAFAYNTNLTDVGKVGAGVLGHRCLKATGITSIDLENVTTLETYVFSECPALNSILNYSHITSFPDGTFYLCTALTSIDLSNVTSLGTNCFNATTALTSITAFNSALSTIPFACFNGSNLTGTLDLENVTTLGSYAFYGNPNLKSVKINSASSIGNGNVFQDCDNLILLDMTGSTFETIAVESFSGCNNLKRIFLPATLTTIGANVFEGISDKIIINPYEGNQTVDANALSNITGSLKITYAHESNTNYITAAQNAGFTVVSYDEALGYVFENGVGTEADPYHVSDFERLNYVKHGLSKHYQQTAGIDCEEFGGQYNFEPIGVGSYFTGNYDGQSYKIKNLYINRTTANSGLFNENQGQLKNIQLSDIDITVTVESGSAFAGGICSYNTGSIDDCHVLSGSITANSHFLGGIVAEDYGSSITNCTNNATISGGGMYTGGIAGDLFGLMENCVNYGNVSYIDYTGGIVGYTDWGAEVRNCRNEGTLVLGGNCGGIVGWNNNLISGCINTGTITGNTACGIVGRNYGVVEDCSNYGNMTATSEFTSNAGGIVGYHEGGIVQRCVNYGDISGDRAGGVARYAWQLEDCYNHGNVAGDTYSGGVAGDVRKPITRCYSASVVTGIGNTGAFAGQVSGDGAFHDCYFDTDVGGVISVGTGDATGITGKTTAEMTSPYAVGVYDAWDFSTIWREWTGDYPRLRWEKIAVKYLNVRTSGEKLLLPLYDTQAAPVLRVAHENEVLGLLLVKTNDNLASPVRVSTSEGIKAIAKEET